MGYRVRLEGMSEVTKLYRQAPEKTILATQDALQKSGDVLVANTVQKIKSKGLVDRGKLLQYTRTFRSGYLQQTVEVDAKYASVLEDGSDPFYPAITPLKAWAKRKLGNEKLAYAVAKSIAKKGMQPRYFHKEAIEISLSEIDQIFNGIFDIVYNS